jgi:hypothetical protein
LMQMKSKLCCADRKSRLGNKNGAISVGAARGLIPLTISPDRTEP